MCTRLASGQPGLRGSMFDAFPGCFERLLLWFRWKAGRRPAVAERKRGRFGIQGGVACRQAVRLAGRLAALGRRRRPGRGGRDTHVSQALLIFYTFDFEVVVCQGITSAPSVSGTTPPSSGLVRRFWRGWVVTRSLALPPARPVRPGVWFSAAGRLRSEGLRQGYLGLRCGRGSVFRPARSRFRSAH